MDFKDYLILLLEVVIALLVVGWSLGFAVASVVGAVHQSRHCDRCTTTPELDTYDEGATEVQRESDGGATVYRPDHP